ncbi:MAG: trypsin-like peptidase domain-containing protein [Isosphaeraceae bacterium]
MSWTIALAGFLGLAGWARAGSESRRTPIVEAVDRVHESVVSISSEKKAESHSRWPFSPEENQRPRVSGMGSGVLIDRRGYILTNHHVVDKVQGIMVQLFDGTTMPARLLQFDPAMDLAVLKVDPPHPLTAIEMGTSSDLMIGETVITIGNAFGYENTVSVGIVSALHRDVTLSDDQVYRNLIQTDACINPGNSGGPLINIEGRLIGINVAVRAGAQGIGFALPIDEVKRVAGELMSTRRLVMTWHGVVAMEQQRGPRRSVVVSEVQQGSPAEASGLHTGDELVKIGDMDVNTVIDVERGLLDARPGRPSKVTVRRGGKDTSVALEVRPLPGRPSTPAGSTEEVVWKLLGVKTLPVTNEYVSAVSTKLRGGLYVQAVQPGSPAAEAALQKGDILLGMKVGSRHWETIRPDNILYVLRQPETAQTQSALLYVVRRNEVQPLKISLGGNITSAGVSR